MELIIINDKKLKIMLTENDLAEFSLNADNLDYSNADTKKMFWDILSHAKHTVGFSTDGHRVLVQLYPSRAGGCEMFVTKLGPLIHDCPCDSSDALEEASYKKKALHCKPSHRKLPGDGKVGVFGFDNISSLLTVCRRLCEIGYEGESSAYRCDNKRYHLFLDGLDSYGYLLPDEFTFINEYGNTENTEAMSYYIEEHGQEICQYNAVEILGAL